MQTIRSRSELSREASTRMTARQTRWFWIALSTVVFLGFVLRVGGSVGELWLDELWSLVLVAPLTAGSQVFTAINHENNHYLISLWMWMLGPDRHWWMYRVPSILAGMGAIWAAIRIGLRQSRATAFVAAVLVSLSYLAVFYSSEARGYAIACCMALVGYDCMENYLHVRSRPYAAGYGLAVVIGMLGNLTYASIAVALGLWSLTVMLWGERTSKSALQLVGLHAPPVAVLGLLWLVDVRKMVGGNGPKLGLWSVLSETISYAFGLPGSFALGGVLVVAVFVFIAWQIVWMVRSRDLRWTFFAAGLLVAPAALLIWTGREFLFPRYFLVNLFVLYLLTALAIGKAWDTHVRIRWLIGGALAAWTLGNLLLSAQLLRVGRGHYKDALEYISANTPGGRAQVGSVQDFRSQVLFGYYQKYLPPAQRPEFLTQESVAQLRPEWVLATISPYEMPELPVRIALAPGVEYVLVKQFPSVQLSGFPAGVYQRSDLSGGAVR